MKTRLIAILSTLVMLAPLANAQGLQGYTGKPEKPSKQSKIRRSELETRPRFNKKVYFTGIGLLGAARAADSFTARAAVAQRGTFDTSLFGSSVYGSHPSVLRQSAVTGAFYAVDALAFYYTEHSRHNWIRLAGRVTVGFLIVDHARSASCNSNLTAAGCKSSLF
jgi:hypothetical protein